MRVKYKIAVFVIILGIITIIAIDKYKNIYQEPSNVTGQAEICITVPKDQEIDLTDEDFNYDKELDASVYKDLDVTKGLDLYVWQHDDKYYFGLLYARDMPHSVEEKKKLVKNPASLDEIKEILATYSTEDIFVWKLNDSISEEELTDIKEVLLCNRN